MSDSDEAPRFTTSFPGFTADFQNIVSLEEPVDFELFVELAIDQVAVGFDLLDWPEGDVDPFALTAAGSEIFLVQWDLHEEMGDRFLAEVVQPTLASQDARFAALFLTTYLTSLTDPDEGRTEAALLSVLEIDGQKSREAVFAADVMRSENSGPVLSEWRHVEGKIAPAIARPLYTGLLGKPGSQE